MNPASEAGPHALAGPTRSNVVLHKVLLGAELTFKAHWPVAPASISRPLAADPLELEPLPGVVPVELTPLSAEPLAA